MRSGEVKYIKADMARPTMAGLVRSVMVRPYWSQQAQPPHRGEEE
jgi:hypothetical protein